MCKVFDVCILGSDSSPCMGLSEAHASRQLARMTPSARAVLNWFDFRSPSARLPTTFRKTKDCTRTVEEHVS